MSRSGEGSAPAQAPLPPAQARRGATQAGPKPSGAKPSGPSPSGAAHSGLGGAGAAAIRNEGNGAEAANTRDGLRDPQSGNISPRRLQTETSEAGPLGSPPLKSGRRTSGAVTSGGRNAALDAPEGRTSGAPGISGAAAQPRGQGARAGPLGRRARSPIDGAPGESFPGVEARKGRGAASNRSGRYERFAYDACDDGWEIPEETARLETVLTRERAKTIINTIESPDLGFERTINPYRGCEHGCIYCYARPAHAYAGLSPGLDFESRLFFKPDAARLFAKALGKDGYQPKLVVIGANTDAYQPSERKLRITRALLETAWRFRHPIAIVTKSALVLRDLDLLAQMAKLNLAKVAVSVTTLENRLARIMEPRAATPRRRVETIKALADAGVPVTVMVAPVIPALNDHEIEAILEACAAAGASRAGYVALRLPLEIKDLFREWLEAHAPDRARRVLKLVREMQGGRDYDPEWSTRLTGQGGYARLIRFRFNQASERLGLAGPPHPSDTRHFRAPCAKDRQLDLFSF